MSTKKTKKACWCGEITTLPHYPAGDPENGPAHAPSEHMPFRCFMCERSLPMPQRAASLVIYDEGDLPRVDFDVCIPCIKSKKRGQDICLKEDIDGVIRALFL